MTMALSFRHLPPEIEAAKQTLSAACKDAMPTRRTRLNRVLLYVLILALGTLVGSILVSLGIVSPIDKEFWRAGMTTVAVLSGFMITTMIFTGKIEAAKSLSVTELREVTTKVTHLLLYQFGTLGNHLLCLFAMFVAPSLATRWPIAGDSITIACLSLFFVSIIRSIFVPMQIIELHRFTHAALLRDKRDEAKKDAEKM
ncbi:MAG: hypothetical protein J0L89_07690 [Xanthomonadales bacterium]|nr:hypothetical protein [Xanthomonadales bacterium]